MDHFYQYVATDEDVFDWHPNTDLLRHKEARAGDHLLTSLQCDDCSFRNLQHQDPEPTLPKDTLLLCCIWRANLDALWGRESSTVYVNLRGIKHLICLWDKVDVSPTLPCLDPFPVQDSLGMGLAIIMLLKSLEPGKCNAAYQQFETVRKLRAFLQCLHGLSGRSFQLVHYGRGLG